MADQLTIGCEYIHEEIDFLTKKVVGFDRLKYLGRHPYDNRHFFALHPSGSVHIPEGSKTLNELKQCEYRDD